MPDNPDNKARGGLFGGAVDQTTPATTPAAQPSGETASRSQGGFFGGGASTATAPSGGTAPSGSSSAEAEGGLFSGPTTGGTSDGQGGQSNTPGGETENLSRGGLFEGATSAGIQIIEGPRGPQGEQGPAGTPGMNGRDGIQGPRGLQGDPGAQGSRGLRGERGLTGNRGSVGPSGPAGPQGSTGAMGEKGDRGNIGPVGPDGPRGPEGQRGARGLTGPQGSQGEIGQVGPVGPRGLRGLTGAAGPRGNVGPVGPDGPAGSKGPTGSRGAIGPRGEQGPQGLRGEDGQRGMIGPAGPVGPDGPMGPRGFNGADGERGERGEQGMRGMVGPEGPDGPAGPDGPQGMRGEQGPQGDIGPEGPQGIVGPVGPRGSGTVVTANPEGTDGDDLTRIRIDDTDYNIAGGADIEALGDIQDVNVGRAARVGFYRDLRADLDITRNFAFSFGVLGFILTTEDVNLQSFVGQQLILTRTNDDGSMTVIRPVVTSVEGGRGDNFFLLGYDADEFPGFTANDEFTLQAEFPALPHPGPFGDSLKLSWDDVSQRWIASASGGEPWRPNLRYPQGFIVAHLGVIYQCSVDLSSLNNPPDETPDEWDGAVASLGNISDILVGAPATTLVAPYTSDNGVLLDTAEAEMQVFQAGSFRSVGFNNNAFVPGTTTTLAMWPFTAGDTVVATNVATGLEDARVQITAVPAGGFLPTQFVALSGEILENTRYTLEVATRIPARTIPTPDQDGYALTWNAAQAGWEASDTGGTTSLDFLEEAQIIVNFNAQRAGLTRDDQGRTSTITLNVRNMGTVTQTFNYNNDGAVSTITYEDATGSVLTDLATAAGRVNEILTRQINPEEGVIDRWLFVLPGAILVLTNDGWLSDTNEIATLTDDGWFTANGWELTNDGYLMEAN